MIEIIPAIDLMDGKCVRLKQGDFSKRTTYGDNPVETARRFEDIGLRRLHVVDLDGARTRKPQNLHVLESIASATNLVVDFGGGIASDADLEDVFNAGASMASIGSVAVRSPEVFLKWIGGYGTEKFLLGADVRGKNIAVNGWQTTTDLDIFAFISDHLSKAIKNVFVTDIAVDGLLSGPAIDLYTDLIRQFPDLRLIASGGVSSVDDLRRLDDIGCTGVIVGKAIYEGHISLTELAAFIGGEA